MLPLHPIEACPGAIDPPRARLAHPAEMIGQVSSAARDPRRCSGYHSARGVDLAQGRRALAAVEGDLTLEEKERCSELDIGPLP